MITFFTLVGALVCAAIFAIGVITIIGLVISIGQLR